jgi:hypothetical protein
MIAALYIIGGLLELTGIGLVAWDVHDAHRNVTQRLTPQRAKELLGCKMPNEFTLMDATAKLVAGNVQRRLLGVVLLGVGLAVQMVGNLAAL